MDQFKKSINKSIKVLVEEIFTFCEGKIKENEEKINSLENTITNHEEELKEISGKYEIKITDINNNHETLKKDYEELKVDYDNYKKVSLVKTLHEELDSAKREIDLLKSKLDKNSSKPESEKIVLTINDVEEEGKKVEAEEEENVEKKVDAEEEEEVEEEVVEEEEKKVEAEEVEEVEESEEEIEFLEKKIRGKIYYVTDDEDRDIHIKLENGEIGDRVGAYVNNRAKFFKK